MKQGSTAMVVLWAVLRTCQDIRGCSKFPHMLTCKAVSIWILLWHIKNIKDHPVISLGEGIYFFKCFFLCFSSASKDVSFPRGIFQCWHLLSMKCFSILLHLSHYTFSISIFIWIPSLFFFLSFTMSYQLATLDFLSSHFARSSLGILRITNIFTSSGEKTPKNQRRNQVLSLHTHPSYIYSMIAVSTYFLTWLFLVE